MTKKLIDRLEELADEMKVIVHQLRVPSTIEAVEDVIEFEGQQYKKVDREACEGDVVRYKNTTSGQFNKDKFYKVLHPITWSEGSCRVIGKDGDDYPLYQKGVGRTSKETDVYELIVEDKPNIQGITIEIEAPKSANQHRAEVIEKAKEFVSNNLTGQYYPDPFHVVSFSNTRGFAASHNVRFIVNDKKGAVVALIVHEHFGTVQYRGIAKCMPTDVFNADIGKAIALGRALGLDVSEFENVVQPERAPEQKAIYGKKYVTFKDSNYGVCNSDLGTVHCNSSAAKNSKIIDDTNAEYEVNA